MVLVRAAGGTTTEENVAVCVLKVEKVERWVEKNQRQENSLAARKSKQTCLFS